MKKILLLFSAAVLFAGFLLSSCKKDVEAPTIAKNTLVTNSQIVSLSSAYQQDDITPCVAGCIGRYFSIVAQDGSKINFGIFCNTDAQTIEQGTYNLNTTDYLAENELGDFWMSVGEQADFTSGSLTITKSGEIYTINFRGVEQGNEVRGNYTGLIPFYDPTR